MVRHHDLRVDASKGAPDAPPFPRGIVRSNIQRWWVGLFRGYIATGTAEIYHYGMLQALYISRTYNLV